MLWLKHTCGADLGTNINTSFTWHSSTHSLSHMHRHTRTFVVLFDSVVFPTHLLDLAVVLQDWQNHWTKPSLLKNKAQRLNIKSTMIWQSINLGKCIIAHERSFVIPELILVFSHIIPKHNHLFYPTQIKTLCFDYSQWFSDKSYTRNTFTHSLYRIWYIRLNGLPKSISKSAEWFY